MFQQNNDNKYHHNEARNSIELSQAICEITAKVAVYLDSVISQNEVLPARSFYGESFSALLFGMIGKAYLGKLDIFYKMYGGKNKDDPEFHWEFNKYAWINLFKETNSSRAENFALPLHFKNTPVTNWTLLRSCTRYHAGIELDRASQEAEAVLKKMQKSSGLICDQPGVHSFQYHCFSAVMVGEIYELGGGEFYLERFRRAADFICRFVLRSGDALYIGRGQEQSFGYGALIYLLALAYKFFQESTFLEYLQSCFSFLVKYQKPDGSFPLVMNEVEKGFPKSINVTDKCYPGWYQYNNYFDYLPFMGVFLHKAANVLASLSVTNLPQNVNSENGICRDRDFLIFRNDIYEAVVAKPWNSWKGNNGYWTNDVPIPYICCEGNRITPSYGGEQYGKSLYGPEGIPFPVAVEKGQKLSIRRDRTWSFFLGANLVVISLSGILVRHFTFGRKSIVIRDRMIGLKQFYAYYLFEIVQQIDDHTFTIRGGASILSSAPLAVEEDPQYFWGGKLQSLISWKPVHFNRLSIFLKESK